MQTQEEAEEAAIKAAARSHRVNQFCWGWFWCMCVHSGLKLIGVLPDPGSPWVHLFFFVMFAMLAIKFQQKVLGVGFSYTVTKK